MMIRSWPFHLPLLFDFSTGIAEPMVVNRNGSAKHPLSSFPPFIFFSAGSPVSPENFGF